MNIASFLAGLFFIGMLVFAYLYYQTASTKQVSNSIRSRLVAARSKMDSIRAADSLEKYDSAGMSLEGLWSANGLLSSPINDVKKAKRYIKNYQTFAKDLLGDLDQAGLPPLTEEVWMDSASVCSLGRLITQKQYNGLRLYMAAYGLQRTNRDDQRTDKGDYDYRITLIAVTTKSDPDVNHKNNHIDVFTDAKTLATVGLVNYHDICPPTCPSNAGDLLAQP